MTQKELTDKLDIASRKYYNGQPTEFTDIEFDTLLHQLQKEEKESGIIYPNSPTQRVGSDIQEGFKKIKHHKPMFTIDNAYDDEGLNKWLKGMQDSYGADRFNISVKYDGISCDICYIGGIFKNASTRGDKLVGDDITENVRTIKSIPLDISKFFINPKEEFHVRGEILLPKSRLASINAERETNGELPFANTRNACSGSIKQLDPKITAKRGLIFRAWDCDGLMYLGTMEDKASFLEELGFFYENETKPFTISYENAADKISQFHEKIKSLNLDYDFDGIVVKVDDIKLQELIGTLDTRAIEWAIARKWNEENIVSTVLNDVEWFVGRTGILTPVGKLEPVQCNGVTITNVTLHNMDFINKNNLSIGDVVFIARSGGVIPYLCGIKEKKSNIPIKGPLFCPECGRPLKIESESTLRCTNPDCKSIIIGKIIHFCSKDCMDIRCIGEEVAKDLYDKYGLRSLQELCFMGEDCINAEDIANEMGKGYGIKFCKKMLDGIKESKKKPFANVLYALGIPGIGKVNARVLTNHFENIDTMMAAQLHEFKELDGFGDIMADSVYQWCRNEKTLALVSLMKEWGFQMSIGKQINEEVEDKPLAGKIVCFTGKSQFFKGDKVEAFLENKGAKCVHSISKSTDYLIIGEKPGGAKVEKAKQNNVKILAEQEFFDIFALLKN